MADNAGCRRRQRVSRDRPDYLSGLQDKEIVNKYRLNRHQIIRLHDETEEHIKPSTKRSNLLSAMTKVNIVMNTNI